MAETHGHVGKSLTMPLIGAFAITPDDNNDLGIYTRQIRVTGSAGNIAVVWVGGDQTVEPGGGNGGVADHARRIADRGHIRRRCS
jgi:hypothetical protein